MLIKSMLRLGFAILCSSCDNVAKTSAKISDHLSDTTATKAIHDSLYSGCYSQIATRDTANLQIENKGSSINGSLSYNIFQKDRNDGTLKADISADILIGWYLFKSEGIISVRQVAWKIRGNELWPGTGEVVQKNDTMFFSQPGKLQFDSTRPFRKVDCVI